MHICAFLMFSSLCGACFLDLALAQLFEYLALVPAATLLSLSVLFGIFKTVANGAEGMRDSWLREVSLISTQSSLHKRAFKKGAGRTEQ